MGIKAIQETSRYFQGTYAIPTLPLSVDLETKAILKKSREAAIALAELKGFAASIPNQNILINTLSLQEAKDSAAIENIITTHDELFQSDVAAGKFTTIAAKEVHCYASALLNGFKEVKRTGLVTNNLIERIQAGIEGNDAGFRTQAGTALKNQQTGQIVYIPPQEHARIIEHMNNLEKFVNDNELSDWDPLIKMAVIHHQFESIHPFIDGNGRTGRILNILYLVQQELLDTPILYLSRYINQNKSKYYQLLQAVRDSDSWEEWVMFILEGIRQTSYHTIRLVEQMKILMLSYKNRIRQELPKIYSQDLLNNLFNHPYTKIIFLEADLAIKRRTAAKYLDELVRIGILSKHKISKENFYLNDALSKLFLTTGSQPMDTTQ